MFGFNLANLGPNRNYSKGELVISIPIPFFFVVTT